MEQITYPRGFFADAPSDKEITPSCEILLNFLKNQDPFFFENWRKFIASRSSNLIPALRVRNGVITVCNGSAFVRLKGPSGVEDGFYTASQRTVYKYAPQSSLNAYPDIDAARPVHMNMGTATRIEKAQVRSLLRFASECQKTGGGVVLEKGKISLYQKPDYFMNITLGIEEPAMVFSENFIYVLKEMMRYEYIFLARQTQRSPHQAPMPIILGLDWDSCGMVSSLNTRNSSTALGL